MPEPTLDLLGRPVWEVSVDDVSKAYRKLARFCHPDKVGGMSEEEAARAEKAYETLRLAKECLSKDDARGPYVREHCQFLKPDTTALEIKNTDFSDSVDRWEPLFHTLLAPPPMMCHGSALLTRLARVRMPFRVWSRACAI